MAKTFNHKLINFFSTETIVFGAKIQFLQPTTTVFALLMLATLPLGITSTRIFIFDDVKYNYLEFYIPVKKNLNYAYVYTKIEVAKNLVLLSHNHLPYLL